MMTQPTRGLLSGPRSCSIVQMAERNSGAMKKLPVLILAALISDAAMAQSRAPGEPQTVEVASGSLRLKALLWKPAGRGPVPAVLFNHGRSTDPQTHYRQVTITEAASILGPVFVKHGYAFLYLFRRGEGLSADQGPFIGDLLEQEEATNGEVARRHLQYLLMTSDHLNDALAGLGFLKTLPQVDAHRIAVVGHSFGGQITLLAAERDSTVRAAVAFAAAANSWDGSAELRVALLDTARKITVPIMLLQTSNDYSVMPGRALAAEMARLSKPHVLKIYPSFGHTADDGHNLVYLDIARWEKDVFRFLDEHVRR